MNLPSVFRVVCYGALVLVLLAGVGPAPADVITTGDVDPGGAATQPDPWNVGGNLYVDNEGNGTLDVTDGGVVANASYGYIGRESGSTGEATVAGSGSQWYNLESLRVGYEGTGQKNLGSPRLSLALQR